MGDEPADRAMLIAAYLRARRSMLTPEDAGLPPDPSRRVRGLRREEVAALASISREYYVRLEQGRGHSISPQVQAALGRALNLDDDALSYLRRLVDPDHGTSAGFSGAPIGTSVVKLLEQWSDTPAVLFDRNQDIVFVNDLAALVSPGYMVVGNNMTSMVFTAPAENRTDPRWWETARAAVAGLRFAADPDDPRLHAIIDELSARDEDFCLLWAEHEARPLSFGTSPNWMDGFGWVELAWQILDVPGGGFLYLVLTDPDTTAGAAVRYLASTLRKETSTALPPPPPAPPLSTPLPHHDEDPALR